MRPPRWPAISSSPTCAGSTTTTTSRSKATRPWRSRKMWRCASSAYGWNVWRVGDANDLERLQGAFEVFKKTDRSPDADHRRQPHRLRRARQAGHERRARRTAGRRNDPQDEGLLRLARRRQVPRARRSPEELCRRDRRTRRAVERRLGRSSLPSTKQQYPELAREIEQMQRRELPDGWDKDLPVFPADAKGLASREVVRQGAERHRQESSVAPGRRGGSGALDQDAAHV